MKLLATAVLALALSVLPATAQQFMPGYGNSGDAVADNRYDEPVIIDARQEGYWVIVASIDTHSPDALAAGRRVDNKVAHCGVRTFSDFSHMFDTFNAGYTVYVTGVYGTKGEASRARDAVSRCIPDAYIKYGAYFGE